MAALLNVDPSELATVVANTQQVTLAQTQALASLAAGSAVSVGIASASAGTTGVGIAGASVGTAGTPLPKITMSQQISQSEFARVRTTVEGVRTLNQSLTPASWAGIHGYILGAFKAQITKP